MVLIYELEQCICLRDGDGSEIIWKRAQLLYYFLQVFVSLSHNIYVSDVLDSIGYMIMLYPSCIIISHVGPSIWLPACEVSQIQIRHTISSNKLVDNVGNLHMLFVYSHKCQAGKGNPSIGVRVFSI